MSEPIQSISQGNYVLATQQEVSHDNTLSGNGTSASPLGLNETILFSGSVGQNSNASLSDSWHNYDRIKVYGYSKPAGGMCYEARVADMEAAISDGSPCPDINLTTVGSWVHRNNFNVMNTLPIVFSSNSSFGTLNERIMGYWDGAWNMAWNTNNITVTKVVGIK